MQILGFKNHRHPDQHKLLFSQHILEKAERVFEFGFETKTEDFSENMWLKDSSLSMSSFSKSSSLEKRHENRREERKESSPACMAQ